MKQRHFERKLLFLGVIGNYSSRAARLRIVCDHYLDLGQGLHEGSGKVAIWPCPACGRVSFVASFDERVVGCAEEGCEIPASMGLLEFIAYLDEGLEVGDERGASEKFGEILEAAISREQEHEAKRKERRRRAREAPRRRGFSEGELGQLHGVYVATSRVFVAKVF